MYAYIHDQCGKVAFLMKIQPLFTYHPRSKDALHVDGRPMEPLTKLRGDSCGERVRNPTSADVLLMI